MFFSFFGALLGMFFGFIKGTTKFYGFSDGNTAIEMLETMGYTVMYFSFGAFLGLIVDTVLLSIRKYSK